jgi:hypothetical protein
MSRDSIESGWNLPPGCMRIPEDDVDTCEKCGHTDKQCDCIVCIEDIANKYDLGPVQRSTIGWFIVFKGLIVSRCHINQKPAVMVVPPGDGDCESLIFPFTIEEFEELICTMNPKRSVTENAEKM